MPADEAKRIGLANELSSPGGSVDRALEVAAVLAAMAPLSLRLSKEAFETSAALGSLEQAIAAQDRSQVLCVLTDDLVEGQRAFNQRRPPRFSG